MDSKILPKTGSTFKGFTAGLQAKFDHHNKLAQFSKKFSLLVLLTVQNAAHVLAMRYVRTRPQEMFLSTVAVFFTEMIKLLTCVLLITVEERSFTKCLKVLYKQIIQQPVDTFKVSVPAIMYIAMNVLMYAAVSNLQAATFLVISQFKIVSAAVFTVLLLHRKLSLLQWITLPVLLSGIVLVQLDEKNGESHIQLNNSLLNDSELTDLNYTTNETSMDTATPYSHITQQKPILGLVAVLLICLLSGFAGVYLERILKNDKKVSIWTRNIQLYIVSLPVSVINIFLNDSGTVFDRGLLVGFDRVVWMTVLLGAFGGLIVSVIIKYADNILKAFATSFGVILSCPISAVIFLFRPTYLFFVGTALVVVAVCVYSAFPYKSKSPVILEPISTVDEEKQRLQPV